MAIKIISLSGYIGSGKNLFCSILQQGLGTKNYVPTWHQKAHAAKLKQIASILLNIPVIKFEDPEFKKTDLGPEWDRGPREAAEFVYFKTGHLPEGDAQESMNTARQLGFKVTRTVREFMQELGTDALRYNLHRDVWVNGLWCDYRPVPTQPTHDGGHRILMDWQAQPEDPNWIITDTRFQNEIKAVKDRNGVIVRINRAPRTSDHESEVTIDQVKEWDYTIDNTGSLQQLHDKAKEFIHYFNL